MPGLASYAALVCSLLITYLLHLKDVFGPPPRPAAVGWTQTVEDGNPRKAVSFTSKDGVVLRGWQYFPAAASSTYVIFFYGSNGDLVHEQNRLQWLSRDMHVNAICFDYRGYGFSGGSIDVPHMRDDALQEYDYVQGSLVGPGSRIVAYGWSIGTHFAIHVAREREVAALILQAPPASAEEMSQWSSHHDVPTLARAFVHVKADESIRSVYQGVAGIEMIKAPLLVVHGEKDDVVPIQQGREVLLACRSTNKRIVIVPGVHHNDLPFSKPPAADAVASILASVRVDN